MSTTIEEQETEETEDEHSSAERRRLRRQRNREREQEVEEALDQAEQTVELKVFRYDPEVPEKEEPRFDSFTRG
jgi:succinate dehydrogenase / fumarate reductase iron-sulfur subunit